VDHVLAALGSHAEEKGTGYVIVTDSGSAGGRCTTPQGDGSIANGGDSCQVVEVNEYADVPAQGLNANEFCQLHGPCSGQVRLPPSVVDGAFAVEAVHPQSDPPAIWIVSDKENLEIDVGVGWGANLGRMQALLRNLCAQHLGT
jgi:hypothetical protein